MNYTDTKTNQFIKQMKENRIPSFMGGLSDLLSKNMRIVDLSEFTRGLNEGKLAGNEEGFNLGLEKGLKEFIVNGENQIFVDKKDGKVYMFRNNAQLLDSTKIGTIVKDFTANEVYKPKNEAYQKFIDDYVVKLNDPQNDFIDFETQTTLVKKHLEEREKNIRNRYSKLISDGDQLEIHQIDQNNDWMIDALKEKFAENLKSIDTFQTEAQTKEIAKTKKLSKVAKARAETILEKLNSDISNLEGANEFISSDLPSRVDFKEMIDDYIKDSNLFEERNTINDEIESFKNNKTKVTNKFTAYKNRSTAMMLTDNFNIYNVEQIRKIYPKIDGPVEADIFAKIKERKEFAKSSEDIINSIADYRTNKQQITLQNLDSQLLIPQQKVKFEPDYYLYMKYPKEGEPLELEASIKKSKYTKKSTKK